MLRRPNNYCQVLKVCSKLAGLCFILVIMEIISAGNIRHEFGLRKGIEQKDFRGSPGSTSVPLTAPVQNLILPLDKSTLAVPDGPTRVVHRGIVRSWVPSGNNVTILFHYGTEQHIIPP